jgi:hypothetical protein
MYRRLCLSLIAALIALSIAQPAQALDVPKGRVILTVSGQITRANGSDGANFDMAMLAALPQHSFRTVTPWHAEPRTYSGPLLLDVLAAAGSHGERLTAMALNRYRVAIPATDASQWQVIVAREVNGQPMAIRDKGPLFIIYPFDNHSDLRNERYYSRSAWQLRRIEVN